MITELQIKNFKSHLHTVLPLKPLTVLAGLNGSGKSSVIQSLLLLRQSYKRQRLNDALILNDFLCGIGLGKDAIYQASENDFLEFGIKTASSLFSWKFSVPGGKDFLPLSEYISEQYKNSESSLDELSLFNNEFQYLSAGRLPEFKYERNDLAVENERQISLENGYGELVAQYLDYWGNEGVKPALKNDNSGFDDLLHQVTAWEREISPNVNVKPVKSGESFTIHYSFDRTGSLGSTDEYKTENTAFGLTYALPVITALLSAKDDALLLIENPEAHLHPRGQSKLAELIALASQAGVQVIIETHSDHIFNGIRKAVAFNKIKKENVSIYFFELDNANASAAAEILLSDKGRVLNYRKGLFDQFDDDLDALLGLQ